MSTETTVETGTETKTESLTRTKGACAAGAGALAITCKTMTLGFFAAGAALVGLSGIHPLALMIGVVVLGSLFFWKGFRWAGRRPALLGIASILFMFFGYLSAGALVTAKHRGGSREFLGAVSFGMWPAGDVATNAMSLVVPAALYLIGTALFFAAVYDSYIKELDVFDSSGAMGAGILGLSVCGGCGLTGVAGAGMVLSTGVVSNDMKYVGADALMSLLVIGIVGYTLYKRAWTKTLIAIVGAILAFFLTWNLFGFPADNGFLGMMGVVFTDALGRNVGEMVETMITWIGLGLMFFALIWAAYPRLEPIPPEWRERILGRPSESA